MALPVLNAPTHELTLTSTGETIQFRPFLVKEEKLLLMALESGDTNEMINAIKQIVSSCVITEINFDNIPLFDLQYIFLQLRSQSVGEVIQLRFKHPDDKNSKGETCDHIQDVEINIKNIKPEKLEGHTTKIQLTDDVGVVMKYPKFNFYNELSNVDESKDAFDAIFKIMSNSIEMIYRGEEVFYSEDHTNEEITEFLGSLNTKQFETIREFFQTMPNLRHEFDYNCDKCGCKEHVILTGIEDFFA